MLFRSPIKLLLLHHFIAHTHMIDMAFALIESDFNPQSQAERVNSKLKFVQSFYRETLWRCTVSHIPKWKMQTSVLCLVFFVLKSYGFIISFFHIRDKERRM